MKTIPTLLIAALTAGTILTTTSSAAEVAAEVTPKGISISAQGLPPLTLAPPNVTMSGDQTEKPVFETTSAASGIARYPSGGEIDVQINGDEITWTIRNFAAAHTVRFEMLIPIAFANGGAFRLGGERREFPSEFAEQLLATADGRQEFSLIGTDGTGFSLTTTGNWQQVQDNRKFGWAVFVYQLHYDLKATPGRTEFAISLGSLQGE